MVNKMFEEVKVKHAVFLLSLLSKFSSAIIIVMEKYTCLLHSFPRNSGLSRAKRSACRAGLCKDEDLLVFHVYLCLNFEIESKFAQVNYSI